MTRTSLILVAALLCAGCDRGPKQDGGQGAPAAPATRPAEPEAPGTAGWKDRAKAAADRGIRYLKEQQTPDGKWSFNSKTPPDLGITSLCLLGMLESPRKYRE